MISKNFLQILTASLITFFFAGCAVTPKPLATSDHLKLLELDRKKQQSEVELADNQLSFFEAVARGLKHNLDHQNKLLEQAIAFGTSKLSNYEMLPKVVASAGYSYRNNYFITSARGANSGNPSLSEPFISSAREFSNNSLTMNWNLLDFGVSYFNARQNADRAIISLERRRRNMHVLIQDIQVAYLRAAAAQKLRQDIQRTIRDASQALSNSKTIELEGLKNPVDALRYQKSLLDNLKILQTLDQELSTARSELNLLINLPANSVYDLEDPDQVDVPSTFAERGVEEFELRALLFNAELNESVYTARIAQEEARKALLRLIPGLSFSVGANSTSNPYYINKDWVETSASVSFNLWNILTAPQAIELADQAKELAQRKRTAVQMAVLSQVHIAKLQLVLTRQIYDLSVSIDEVDQRIAKITNDREREGLASSAERVAADSSAILSRLRRYQALSQLYGASGRLRSATGLEPEIYQISRTPLQELTRQVTFSLKQWNQGYLPTLPEAVGPTAQGLGPSNSASVEGAQAVALPAESISLTPEPAGK